MKKFVITPEEVKKGIIEYAFYLCYIEKDTKFYHYTSVSGFQGIIKSGSLWATEYRYLNDMDEFKFIEELIPEVMDRFGLAEDYAEMLSHRLVEKIHEQNNDIEASDSYFVTCFSGSQDNLTLWSEFADSTGCNICFIPENVVASTDIYHALVGKVIYDKNEQIEIVKNCFEMMLIGNEITANQYIQKILNENKLDELDEYLEVLSIVIRYYSMYFKKWVYRAEDEYRIVCFLKNRDTAAIKYHQKGNLQVPYIEIKISDEFGKIPMHGLCLNPRLHGNEAQEKYCKELSDKGYDSTMIIESDAWLRY